MFSQIMQLFVEINYITLMHRQFWRSRDEYQK